jgi:hypothetical protein
VEHRRGAEELREFAEKSEIARRDAAPQVGNEIARRDAGRPQENRFLTLRAIGILSSLLSKRRLV